jgi:hypothetical protein
LRREGFYIGFREIVARIELRSQSPESVMPDRRPSPALVPGCKGQQGDVPGLLDGAGKAALMGRTYASETTGYDLAALGDKSLQQTNIAIRDGVNLLGAEFANLFAAEELAASTGSAGSTRATTGTATRASTGSARPGRTFTLRCWCTRFGRFYVFVSHFISSSFS